MLNVTFAKNSKLKSIGEKIFFNSTILFLILPSSISELNEGWCLESPNLINILVLQNDEQNIECYYRKFIFNVLIFACLDINEAIIPLFIKEIAHYAFDKCNCLENNLIFSFAFNFFRMFNSLHQMLFSLIIQHSIHVNNFKELKYQKTRNRIQTDARHFNTHQFRIFDFSTY